MAGWGIVLGTAGFQGSSFAGIGYEGGNWHQLDLTVGEYSMNDGHGVQFSSSYAYSPIRLQFSRVTWSPLRLGLLALYAADNDDYFVKSPSKYPEAGYYDQTGIRLGAVTGTELIVFNDRLHLIYEVVFLDSGFIAMFNNSPEEVDYFLSSGLKLRLDL